MCKQSKYNSLMGVMTHFADEKTCLEHLENLRWPDGKPECPHCEHDTVYRFSDGKRFKCKSCRKQFTAKVGTIFESSNLPLRKWFAAIYLATSHKKGISSHQLAKDIDISQKSAWHMLHRIREMVKAKDASFIATEDDVFEVDEHFYGGKEMNKHKSKKLNAGRGTVGKTPILGIVKRGGDVTAKPVEGTGAKVLLPEIAAHVPMGATVYSDEHATYKGLSGMFRHDFVRHSSGEYVVGSTHTNTIESVWACFVRSMIGIYHHASPQHLGSYCDEVSFRYNTRKITEAQRFDAAIAQSDGRQLRWIDLVDRRNAA